MSRPAAKALVARIPPLAWIAALALLFWAIFPRAYPNYDTFYAMAWGQDILNGLTPDYGAAIAPTPHPLAMLLAMLVHPLGQYADDALLAISFFAFAALCWAIYRLGSVLFNWAAGLLAAVIVFTRAPLDSFAVRAYIDIGFTALVAYAAVLEVRRPKSGWPVLVLLGLAGLLRPEAWLIAGVYWLYLYRDRSWRSRIELAALVVAAPLVWVSSDLIISGDLLHSFHGTSTLAEQLGRRRGLGGVPIGLPLYLGFLLREPVLIGAATGIAFAWFNARRQALVPAALAALGVLIFLILAIAGLPLLARYLLITAAMLAVFCGAGAFGWLGMDAGRYRRHWQWAGFVVIALLIAFIPAQVGRLEQLHNATLLKGRITRDLRGLTLDKQLQPYFDRCAPVFTPNHRPVPILRYWLDSPPGSVISGLAKPPAGGLMVAPANDTVARQFVLDPNDKVPLNATPPPSFRKIGGNISWTLYASPGCHT